ncbi:N,N-dimethylformamidase beta subunit family domain-containing protein [Paenibacillus contaminans]|uniref:N,N-dimethylformamidase beta subunit-like C-terminal domain-containing protein n=1 Tax=Paenibacillus contaminans TaxID=450362 RepID=A0A329MJG2_9BACL|nr:N,N-dimethylformamidase beta subunit family domain-containing protein [Paenibacillus contaminans]RAV17797.1 hypothetical protein DQG23_25635 [Paenibacillus contaminans]
MGNRTKEENMHQGTLDWQIKAFQFEYPESQQGSPLIRGLRSKVIEGYASRTSVYPGQTIDLMVSTDPACGFVADIYRLGHYGGTGGRHMRRLGPFDGKAQPVPMESMERLRECQWQPSVSLQIPLDWVSGVYLAKLSLEADVPFQSYIIFVVKQKEKSDILVQVSDLTWQAYNKWPGVNSIYDDGSPYLWYEGPNVRVSFDRPYSKYCQIVDSPHSCGSGEFLLWEFPLSYWLESEGYEVAYCSNLDLHNDPELIHNCKVFISAGHDEYWTSQMYRNTADALEAGVSLLFLSGNTMYHEIIPYHDQVNGNPFRSFARKHRIKDEHQLMGASSYGSGYGDWTVVKPDHWVFSGTGMKKGDSIPGLVGWEYHGAPFPDIEGLEIVAESDLFGFAADAASEGNKHVEKRRIKHAAVMYPGKRQNWVFNAGTIWWAEGLSNPPGHIPAKGDLGCSQGPDPRVQQITRNLLQKCLGER